MNQAATRSRRSAETLRPTRAQHRDESGGLLAALRRLGRELSGLVRWVAKQLRAPLLPIAQVLILRWVATKLPAPLRWLAGLLMPGRERGFGFWWLVATLGIAVALGLVVALLVTPVAGLIALLVVAIAALVHRHRSKRDERDQGTPAAAAAAAAAA
jgi:apolipoprotein N-acyltransferase